MSAHMKKHLTEANQCVVWHADTGFVIFDHGRLFIIPIPVVEQYEVEEDFFEDFIPADEVLGHRIGKIGKPATLLKGLRHREGLTQIEFAKRIGVTQPNLSHMENGRRPIGRKVAKRIAKAFDVNYRYFLE